MKTEILNEFQDKLSEESIIVISEYGEEIGIDKKKNSKARDLSEPSESSGK